MQNTEKQAPNTKSGTKSWTIGRALELCHDEPMFARGKFENQTK
jgi:hypothetical protein